MLIQSVWTQPQLFVNHHHHVLISADGRVLMDKLDKSNCVRQHATQGLWDGWTDRRETGKLGVKSWQLLNSKCSRHTQSNLPVWNNLTPLKYHFISSHRLYVRDTQLGAGSSVF